MPTIIRELDGLNLMPTTSYLLSLTVMVPIWVLVIPVADSIIGIIIFVAGSWLCGISANSAIPPAWRRYDALIIFRGIQAVGGGGSTTACHHRRTLPPRGAAICGPVRRHASLASVISPIVGGYFRPWQRRHRRAARRRWRWCFYITCRPPSSHWQ